MLTILEHRIKMAARGRSWGYARLDFYVASEAHFAVNVAYYYCRPDRDRPDALVANVAL